MGSISVTVNGQTQVVAEKIRILDHLLKQGTEHPHICYSEIMGPIQTCDTCMRFAPKNFSGPPSRRSRCITFL